MEGPVSEPLYDIKRLSETRYSIDAQPYYLGAKSSHINIYLIDPVKKIAVFEDTAQSGAQRYGLFVPREIAPAFDLIVNYCRTEKTDEFTFDKIDFSKLITACSQKSN